MTRAELERAALREAGKLTRDIAGSIKAALVIALPAALRLACVVLAVLGAAAALPALWRVFGADVVAMLPAAALMVAPIAYTLSTGLSWGGLLLSGAINWIVSLIAPTFGEVALTLALVAIVSAALLSTLSNERTINDE
jgi:hypothetical protein